MCKVLTDIRKQIADANDIRYDVRPCSHEGDCTGTCPRCEAEVQYLERELTRRQKLGKAVKVAGLVTVAAMSAACSTIENPPLAGDPLPPQLKAYELAGTWSIRSIGDITVDEELHHPTLTMAQDSIIKISSGCNTLEGRYVFDEERNEMRVTWGGETEIWCADEALRELEERLFGLFRSQEVLILEGYSNRVWMYGQDYARIATLEK